MVAPRPGGLSDRVAYRAQQASLLHLCATFHRRFGLLRDGREAELDEGSRHAIWRRYSALLERDLLNVREGLYPRGLLFDVPLLAHALALPSLARSAPEVSLRRAKSGFLELPEEVELDRYPPYYRQTFHWQTDGYLSRRSAELYEVAVEVLFFGTADVMRRQVIPPITRELAALAPAARPRLLDVGAGTGRTLSQLARAHPSLALTGLELSPYYAELARERLRTVADLSMVVGNAEALPFRDGWFDVVTCTYLLHELPRAVRRRAISEMLRVLKPGGLLVVEDSAQVSEAGELRFFMDRFAAEFHEPYFLDYVEDDLGAMVSAAGCRVEAVEAAFIAKVLVARKSR